MTTPSQTTILLIGSALADIICHVPKLPRSGEGVIVERRSIALGGCASNVANIIRQLEQPSYLFAPLGQGVYANFIAHEFAKRGIETLPVATTMDSGSCICMVEPDGERTLLTLPGVEQHYRAEWFDALAGRAFGSAYICGYEVESESGEAILGFLEQHPKIELVYAPGPRICSVGAAKTKRINALKPLWHVNELEALSYTGAATLEEAGACLLAQCDNAVIITQGAKGAHLFSKEGQLFVPTQTRAVVDTIGAGDAHVGTVMAARNAGYSWVNALDVANRIAGAICEIPGATFEDADFKKLGIRLA
jgi:sugar/nucleoside kinase (ribokinase family)